MDGFLSKAMALILPNASSGRPPLIKTPWRAALAIPANTALGVEMANAQGEAAIRTDIAL